MTPEEQLIDDLAQAVLDGDTVDWDATLSSGSANRLIRHLKVVATLAELHREKPASPSAADSSRETDPPALETWGHLRLAERIGRGAFGVVYRAFDTRLDREVALKLIAAQTDTEAAAASSIIREGRLLARVRHPNVATIYGADRIDGYVGLWMEFVRGRTLEELLRAGTRFEPDEVARIGRELGRALAAVHAAGLLHRDIKAQNVMRADDGRIVLMDFGTGRELSEQGQDLAGTPLYLAPEVLRGQPATERSDIYSLGILLYHLLTGSYPFQGKTIRELRVAHEQTVGAQLRDHREIPPRIAHVISRAIDPQSERRHATASALCADLSETVRVPSVWRWRLQYAAAVAVLLSILAWVAADSGLDKRSNRSTDAAASTPANLGPTRRLTTQDQLEIDPAISPDGTLVAYSAGTHNLTRVFVRPVGGDRAVRVSNDGRGISQLRPRWSPDQLHLVYVTYEGAFVVPATGGEARRIDSLSDPVGARTQGLSVGGPSGVRVTGAAWSPDAQKIAIAYGGKLTIVTLNTGHREHLSVDWPSELHECDWSPDDTWLACTSGNFHFPGSLGSFGNVAPSAIVLVPTRGGPVVELIRGDAARRSPVWRGDHLYFVSNHEGTSDVYSVAISPDGRMRGNLARFGLEAQSISFSADGQTLAYLKFDATSNIWSLPIPTYGETSNAANAKQVTTGAQIVESVSISPDERWLLYDSTLHGNADIFRVPIGGGGPEPLTSDPSDDFAPQLSPSGLLVAFHSFRTKTRDVFLLPIGGGPTEQVTNTLGQESFPIWSPDGGSIAFLDQTARDGAQRREYVVHRSGSGTWEKPIPTGLPEGVNSVTWLRDGRLVYVLAGSIGIASSEFDKGNVIYDPRKIGARPVLCMRMAPWDDRTLYFKTDAEGRASFWSIPVSGGQPTRLFTLDDLSRPSTFNSFAVGAGRVFFPVAEQRSLIWVRKLTDQKAR